MNNDKTLDIIDAFLLYLSNEKHGEFYNFNQHSYEGTETLRIRIISEFISKN